MINHKTTKDKKIKVGVVGYPINHTLSPRLHSYWLKKYKILSYILPLDTLKLN